MRVAFAFASLLISPWVAAQAPVGVSPPRLVVVVSVDQFRADYFERFFSHYLPAQGAEGVGGMRWLASKGAVFLDAHQGHVPTATGPGHATLLTGSEPSLNGIVGNDWFDPAKIDWTSNTAPSAVYCVTDPKVKTVGGESKPMSPRNLKVTTLGDELKMATNAKSKVVGIAYKDRASILMAGHAADTVVWMNDQSGDWVSSSFYCPDMKLPGWVAKLNAEDQMERQLGKSWEPLLPASAYELSRKAPAEKAPPAGKVFSHALGTERGAGFYRQFMTSGYGNDYVCETMERAVDAEGLGQDDAPDLLVVNLSTNDYVGHRFGPNSPEVVDVSVRTDRMFSRFFRFLAKKVKGGLGEVVVVITADHGVVPIPEESDGVYRTGALRAPEEPVVASVEAALNAQFGDGRWCWFNSPNLYLNRALIAERKLDRATVERAAADAVIGVPGIYSALTRTQVMHGAVPALDWAKGAVNSYYPLLSGDVLVFESPGTYLGGGTGTGHGSPWPYDSHVPIVMAGKGVRTGRFSERVYTSGIAPTLCHLLGVEYPTGCTGRPLGSALGG